MEFYSVTKKITFDDKIVSQKRLTKFDSKYIYTAIFIIWFINSSFDKLMTNESTNNIYKWSILIPLGFLSFLGIFYFIDLIFKRYWKRSFDINKIKRIEIYKSDNPLEKNVKVIMISNRYTIIRFRTLEHQYEAFIENICLINNNIVLLKK